MDLVKEELIKKRLEINQKIKIFTKILNQNEDKENIKQVLLVLIYDLRKERKILNYSILNYDYLKFVFHV
jgi:hypothetical protein